MTHITPVSINQFSYSILKNDFILRIIFFQRTASPRATKHFGWRSDKVEWVSISQRHGRPIKCKCWFMSLVGRDGVYRWLYISQSIDVNRGEGLPFRIEYVYVCACENVYRVPNAWWNTLRNAYSTRATEWNCGRRITRDEVSRRFVCSPGSLRFVYFNPGRHHSFSAWALIVVENQQFLIFFYFYGFEQRDKLKILLSCYFVEVWHDLLDP